MMDKLLGNLGTVMKIAAFVVLLSYVAALAPQLMKYDDSEALHTAYNVISREAFAGGYVWDGNDDTKTIIVPDRTHGVKITSLGGYYGKGFPTPFGAVLPEVYQSWGEGVIGDRETFESVRAEKEAAGVKCSLQEIKFFVELGRYVKSAELTTDEYYVRNEADGSVTFTHPVYYFLCDEANKTFYSENGKLFENRTGTCVTDFAYSEQ